MYINATGFYVPEERVPNQHFFELNGLTSEWIEQRTGIKTRSKARPDENINTMGLEAIRNALPKLPYDIKEIDLIVAASYSPYDTVATAAHVAQREFQIQEAKAQGDQGPDYLGRQELCLLERDRPESGPFVG